MHYLGKEVKIVLNQDMSFLRSLSHGTLKKKKKLIKLCHPEASFYRDENIWIHQGQ